MELLVFGHAGVRTLVFPTRQGRFYDYENWGLVEACRSALEAGQRQLFCVDSVDSESFYCHCRSPQDRLARHRQYESYVLNEVVPLATLVNSHPSLAAHGCSIGAFHAVNIALRHPQRFQEVIALSGRYDLTRRVGPFADLFDGYYDEDVYFHTPTHFLPGLADSRLLAALRHMRVMLAVGGEDPFLASNLELDALLRAKGVSSALAIWDGEAHRACHWRRMVGHYLVS